MRGECNGSHRVTDRLISFLDDFNRVILSMRRGQEFTDYVNASFIDVSRIPEKRRIDVVAQTELTECVCSGLQTEGLLHRHSGPAPPHRGRLLEDGVGMEMSLHRHAHGAPGEGAGEQPPSTSQSSPNISAFNIVFRCYRTNAASTGPQRTPSPTETTRWS